jgi:F-type H+-transporting ATPase subunit a
MRFFKIADAGVVVSLPAEHIFNIGSYSVTNSTILGLVGIAITLGILFYTMAKVKSRNHNRVSIAVLWMFETLLTTAEEVTGDRKLARRLAPLAITLFFVIIINNWLELLPFVGPVTYKGVPLFRGLAADLNFTAALAIITMVTAQIYAVRAHGFFGNLGRYFVNPLKDPIGVFTGFLEIIAEFSRLIALAMRLFGNIFGGEVLLAVMGFITAWAAPIALPPFMLLELFVGAIQAYVFFMLTVVFISLGTASHNESEADSPVANESREAAVA